MSDSSLKFTVPFKNTNSTKQTVLAVMSIVGYKILYIYNENTFKNISVGYFCRCLNILLKVLSRVSGPESLETPFCL